ncbi:MAG: DUF874 family protein [Candidatus Lokiarchaeota archaeon]|nr:DUF874 family protein [Candidatus Lokiarchaeota archaeon]
MTQDETRPFKSTRINSMEPDTFDQSQPRIGRRESEPHSLEVGYLHDVLESNFPNHHVLLDLHHYFQVDGDEVDIQFDVSFFLGLSIPYTLSSYRAIDYQNRVPALAINIMSKSTWRADLSENLDLCGMLRIPVYIVFAPFDVATKFYRPPFARVYQLQTNGSYSIKEIRSNCVDKDGTIIAANLIDLDANIPFRIGIEELVSKHEKVQNRYRLVPVHQHSLERLPTRIEQEKQRAEQERQRAEQEKQRAEQERQRAEQEKQRAEKYLQLLKDHGIEP